MRARHFVLALALGAAATSCGEDSEKQPSNEPQYEPNKVYEEADGIVFTTEEFEIPVGDSFTCFYTNHITEEELSIIGADGLQGNGGHHILAYYAEEPREPGYHPCTDTDMVNLHQVAGNAGEGGQVLNLPDGLALKVPAGKQIVLEAHYINETGKPYRAFDWVKLVKGDPAKIQHYVNYLVTIDEAFEIPPNAPLKRVTECTLDRDFNVALSLGHMHELGSAFKLEVLDEAGTLIDAPLDHKWTPSYTSHPPINTYEIPTPYVLKKGQRIRQTCEWNNSTASPVIFPREMCIGFFYYWPGEGDLTCETVEVGEGG